MEAKEYGDWLVANARRSSFRDCKSIFPLGELDADDRDCLSAMVDKAERRLAKALRKLRKANLRALAQVRKTPASSSVAGSMAMLTYPDIDLRGRLHDYEIRRKQLDRLQWMQAQVAAGNEGAPK